MEEKKPNYLEDCKIKQQHSFESSKETPEKNKSIPPPVGASKQMKSPPTDNKEVIHNPIPNIEQQQPTNISKDSQLNLKFALSHNNSNTKPPTNPNININNSNQNNNINKGFISPKNDSNQHFPNFRITNASPPLTLANETNKPTISSLLDKKKIMINNANNNINNSESLNLNNINIGANNFIKSNDEAAGKFEKTSRLTSPKQNETTTNALDTKEKGGVVGGGAKPLYKPANNLHIYNAINVF